MLWLSKQYVGAWRMSLLLPLSMLVGGRTMHARECKGMLVGAGDLLRQIAATKGIKKEHEELKLAKVPKSCLKSVQK